MDTKGIGGARAWRVCFTAGLFFFYEFFQLNSLDVLNPFFSHHFQLDASTMSELSSVFLVGDLLFLIPAGILFDRFSVKRVMLWALLVCLIGVLCLAISEKLWLVGVGRFLTGIGCAFCFLACVILVSRWFKPAQQGLLIGLMVTLAFLGGLVAHAPFLYLIQHIGWRASLWIDALIGGLLGVLIYVNVRSHPSEERAGAIPRQVSLLHSLLVVARCPQTYLAGLYTAILNLPVMVLCALWGERYLTVAHYLSPMQAAQIVSLIFFGSMIGSPLFGWLSDWQGKRKPMMWVGIVGTLLMFLPLFLPMTLHVPVLSLIFLGLGLFTSAQVLSYPLLAESHLPEHVGEATALASIIIMGGAALGQLLFGVLMDHRHIESAVGYTPGAFQFAMILFPVTVALSGVILLGIKEPAFLRGDTSCN